MARRGFVSTLNRISREMERSARASQRAYENEQRAQLRAAREAERAEKAYQRSLIADEKEKKRLHVESQMEDAQSQNQELEEQVQALGKILADGIRGNPVLDFAKLRTRPTYEPLDLGSFSLIEDPPRWDDYAPAKPKGMSNLLPWVKKKHAEEESLARQRFEAEAQARVSRNAMRQTEVKKRRDAHERIVEQAKREAAEHNQRVEQLERAFRAADPNAIASDLPWNFRTS
ncbi:hypothetical protein [Burkholderia orbicola]|uniref:hypothetical protein n=1 Tax=Burkholderia orbicola TaxID=2978683 RepID=UPI002FE325E3